MASLLQKVRARVSIVATRRVRTLVEGEYLSMFKSRGLDFEDLRIYVPGDNVKDIDWRATMRSGQALVRQYAADRNHRVVFAVDTGRSMSCLSSRAESKAALAVMVIGVIGYLAQAHGDTVGLISADAAGYRSTPPRRTNAHLERILQQVAGAISADSPTSDLPGLLDRVTSHLRHQSIVVIVTDDVATLLQCQAALRRLRARHELMCIVIDDLLPTDPGVAGRRAHDVDTLVTRPHYVCGDQRVALMLQELVHRERAELELTLDRLRIGHLTVSSEDGVVNGVLAMLDRMRRVHSR